MCSLSGCPSLLASHTHSPSLSHRATQPTWHLIHRGLPVTPSRSPSAPQLLSFLKWRQSQFAMISWRPSAWSVPLPTCVSSASGGLGLLQFELRLTFREGDEADGRKRWTGEQQLQREMGQDLEMEGWGWERRGQQSIPLATRSDGRYALEGGVPSSLCLEAALTPTGVGVTQTLSVKK